MSAFLTPAHKFAIGTKVKLFRSIRGVPLESSLYEVTRQLPSENNDFQYRIRTLDGRVDRVAFESQLALSTGDEPVSSKPLPRVR
jgi:hypothetical protein